MTREARPWMAFVLELVRIVLAALSGYAAGSAS